MRMARGGYRNGPLAVIRAHITAPAARLALSDTPKFK